ncbi:hypothetical protein J7E67_10305 [Bacillus sp. ISL-46]|nr:hypothetical protein [Bacillus sp. ISL-46]
MIERFFERESEYEAWYKENKSGYVLNYFDGTEKQSKMNKVHIADCPYLRRKSDEGKRTTKYEKVCSNNIEELLKFVKEKRGNSWEPCNFCKPLEVKKESLL